MSNTGFNECILWDGYFTKGGYGRIWVKESKREKYVHRIAWEEHNGPIPEGKVIRHKCDVPQCVNIDHLEIGTQGDNIRDMYERISTPEKRSRCKRGHERTAENTGVHTQGHRYCKPCARIRARKQRESAQA